VERFKGIDLDSVQVLDSRNTGAKAADVFSEAVGKRVSRICGKDQKAITGPFLGKAYPQRRSTRSFSNTSLSANDDDSFGPGSGLSFTRALFEPAARSCVWRGARNDVTGVNAGLGGRVCGTQCLRRPQGFPERPKRCESTDFVGLN